VRHWDGIHRLADRRTRSLRALHGVVVMKHAGKVDRTFHYTPASQHDEGYLKRKFAQVRREQRDQQRAREANSAEAEVKVAVIAGRIK
jgi:hypothetical protein